MSSMPQLSLVVLRFVVNGACHGPADERHQRAMARSADPAALVEAEWHAAGQMADKLDLSGNKNLARSLRLRAGELPSRFRLTRFAALDARQGSGGVHTGENFGSPDAEGITQPKQHGDTSSAPSTRLATKRVTAPSRVKPARHTKNRGG